MMFKIFSESGSPRPETGAIPDLPLGRSGAANDASFAPSLPILLAFFALQLLVFSGCTLVRPPRMPPADLQQPGWSVREGQAVWHLPNGATDLAGDLLLATHPAGGAFVQFTKSPFTLVVAHSTPDRWEVEFATEGRRYGGRGRPPQRLIWLQLPHVLAGHPPPENCTWQQTKTGWKLMNHRTGEALEGYFNP